jgi:hypothetical protein
MKLKIFFCQFPNPWAPRVSGMDGYTSKCEKKSQNHCTLVYVHIRVYTISESYCSHSLSHCRASQSVIVPATSGQSEFYRGRQLFSQSATGSATVQSECYRVGNCSVRCYGFGNWSVRLLQGRQLVSQSAPRTHHGNYV